MASRHAPSTCHPTARLLGTSPAMATLRAQIQHLVRFDTLGNPAVPTLLLQGETGTGKSLVARVVHDSGPRAAGPFLAVNCAALPETMLEAELFGFEAGAFTDAKRAKPGLCEAAVGGTLFLDEIDAVPLTLQGKLLTALETKRVRRLGAVADRPVDVKLIAATNTDLGQAVASGRLRADLYHRLAVVVLTLPPLRERGDDVLVLTQTLLERLAVAHGVPPKRVQPDAGQWLRQYGWPGNVRELSHLLERVTLLHPEDALDAATLARWCQGLPDTPLAPTPPASAPAPQPVGPAEMEQVHEALTRAGGNVTQAARLLGLSRDQLRTRMRRYGLTRPPLTPLTPPPSTLPVLPSVPRGMHPVDDPAPVLPQERVAHPGPEAADTTPSLAVTPATHPAATSEALGQPAAERRQLTVLWCTLADATVLASRLDPEDWGTILRRYHALCAEIVTPFAGFIAQYLWDGVLVYFGYPQAHEDDAQRAVRAGLALGTALARLPLQADLAGRLDRPLAGCIGIHTSRVIIEAAGVAGRQEALAVGEAPQVAARLQQMAAPGTVVCSATTAHLVRGYMTLEALEVSSLPAGVPPGSVYQVRGESGAQSRLDAHGPQGLTPLVGRDHEVALLQERWGQVQDGDGQVVVLTGEAGIGKSRLVQVLREQVVVEGTVTSLLGQCALSHQQSPFAPLIDALARRVGWPDDAPPAGRLEALAQHLTALGLSLPAVLPWLATLLALPLPAPDAPPVVTPQQHKQQTLEALLHWLLQEAAVRPVLLVVEDVHWADPSTLEWLTLVLDQVPTLPLYVLCTCRLECTLPWGSRAYITHITLPRLPQPYVKRLVQAVAGERTLPHAVLQQVVSQTDGVPLFVEELTKMVLESDPFQTSPHHFTSMVPLPPLAIPNTLQDSLMARLDRQGSAKAVAQLGATIGRQFAYAVLQAVVPGDEEVLQRDLAQLVAAELLYQRGVPPQATYRFKHALVQEAAYQSLLKRTRQQYHRQIAQVLTERFPELTTTQPEVLAQHYTEAGLAMQAVESWHRAGQQAAEHAAYAEAITHFSRGIAVLQTLPDTPIRQQYDLTLHLALGAVLLITKGYTVPEVEHAYSRAYALCQQVGETPELPHVLLGLWRFYVTRSQLHTARDLGDMLLRLTQQRDDPALSATAHSVLGYTWLRLGVLPVARQHLEAGMACYAPEQQCAPKVRIGQDVHVACRAYGAETLWLLGYPAQALACLHEALALADALSHPFSLAFVRCWAALVSQFCRDVSATRAFAEAAVVLSTEQGFTVWSAMGTSFRGWALAIQGQGAGGLTQLRQGITAWRAPGAALGVPSLCTLLAEVCGQLGHTEDALQALTEAQELMEQHEERWWEAEVYRLRGVLLLRQTIPQPGEAEAWLQRALDTARRQEAKSLELRAAISLARLWQQQGKRAEAQQLLAEVYGWFTEGFDTADLQEAQALLEALA